MGASIADRLTGPWRAVARLPVPRLLLWAPTIIIVASAVFLALTLSYYRGQTIEEGRHLASSFVRIAEEHMARTLHSLESALQTADERLAAVAPDSAPLAVKTILRDRINGRPYIHSLRVTDLNGRIRFSTAGDEGADISGEPWFKIFRGLPEGGFELATPVRGIAQTGAAAWYIPALRPWRDAEGRVIGLMVAKIEPWYFSRAWRLDGDNSHAVISLLRADGVSLARSPFDPAFMGRSMARYRLFTELLAKEPSGTFMATSNRAPAILSYRRMATYPNYVIIFLKPLDTVLEEWWQYTRLFVASWVIASLVLAGLCFWLSREWRARKANEARYGQLFDASPMPMCVMDRRTQRILAVNDAAVARYGYSRAEFLRLGASDIRSADGLGALGERLAPGVLESAVTPLPGRHRLRDGALIDVEVAMRAIDFAGRPAVLVAVNDVTQRNRAEQQLRQAQKMEAVGQMTGGIAHDFNNLLAVIIMEMESLADELASDSSWRNSVDNALAAAIRGSELIARLQDFARKGELKPRRTDIARLLRELRPLIAAAVPEVNVEIAVEATLPRCMVDRTGLETALLNLAVNARDAMAANGTLSVTARARSIAEDADELGKSGMLAGDWLEITVSDSGRGMSREIARRVFEPFFTTKAEGHGTGLGLSMVCGFMIRSGGFITVDSEPGSGTTFALYLPSAPAAQPARSATAPLTIVDRAA